MIPVGLQVQVQPYTGAVSRGGSPSNTGVWLDPTSPSLWVWLAQEQRWVLEPAGISGALKLMMPLGLPWLIAQFSLGLAPSPGNMRVQLEKQLAAARTLITGFFPGNRLISKPKFLTPTRESHLPVPSTYPRSL